VIDNNLANKTYLKLCGGNYECNGFQLKPEHKCYHHFSANSLGPYTACTKTVRGGRGRVQKKVLKNFNILD